MDKRRYYDGKPVKERIIKTHLNVNDKRVCRTFALAYQHSKDPKEVDCKHCLEWIAENKYQVKK